MKIVKQIPTFLLGLVFSVFGVMFFLHLMPNKQPEGNAGVFTGLLFITGYLNIIKIFEVAFGALLLIPRTRALGLILIAPICVGILMYEIFIANELGIGIVLILLNTIGIIVNKDKYLSIIK